MSNLTDNLNKDLKSVHLTKTDRIVILIHPTIGLLIWLIYQIDILDSELLKSFTSGYLFLLPLLLLGLFFRKLRKIKFYLVWLTISIIQLFIYPMVKDNTDFTFPRGTAFDGLIGLLPTLLMFQLLRQIFYSIKGKEMIISIQKYRWTMYEKEDRRNMTWLDIVFSIILALIAVLSGPLLTS